MKKFKTMKTNAIYYFEYFQGFSFYKNYKIN